MKPDFSKPAKMEYRTGRPKTIKIEPDRQMEVRFDNAHHLLPEEERRKYLQSMIDSIKNDGITYQISDDGPAYHWPPECLTVTMNEDFTGLDIQYEPPKESRSRSTAIQSREGDSET